MPKYIATFEMPAIVRVDIEVDAPNQQEGIIAAHDLALSAAVAQARVVKLDAQAATNTAFERVQEVAADVPASPLELSGVYRVEFRYGPSRAESPDVARTSATGLAYGSAKALAETVLAEDSLFGSAQVFDQFNNKVLEVKSPLGGFIVEVRYLDASTATERFPWIATDKEAKKTAVTLLDTRKGVECVRIFDFSKRSNGMRLMREIR